MIKSGSSLLVLALSISMLVPGFVVTGSSAADLTAEPGKAGRDTSSGHNYSNKQITHLLNRITFGPGPGDIEAVKKMGVDAYIEQQLHPESIGVPDDLKELAQTPALSESPAKLFLTYGRPALKALATKSGSDKEEDKKELQKILRQTYQKIFEDTASARIERAVYSPAQLQEVMTDFWYNHFNISMDKNLDHLWVGSYEENAIRPYALGKFRDILGATAHHAAMLFYLDNWQNTAANSPLAQSKKGRFQGINENYARELMELHTLGVDGGYTQKDVQELARVLTGLGLPPGAGGGFGQPNRAKRLALAGFGTPGGAAGFGGANSFAGRFGGGGNFGEAGGRFGGGGNFGGARGGFNPVAFGGGEMMQAQNALLPAGYDINNKFGSYFDSRRHDYGDKLVVGHEIKGSGEAEIEQVLDVLAKHPSTAHHISYQLAQYFVADNPPASLVDKLSRRFLETDGDIAAVLNTLFHSSEFWDEKEINSKFKSPYRYLLSSLRATDAQIDNVKPCLGILTQLGQPLYKCLTPDGYKNTKEAWLNPDNLINRINFATAYGAGRFPGIKPEMADPGDVADCIGPTLSQKTMDAVTKASPQLRIALLLGSPEFMKY